MTRRASRLLPALLALLPLAACADLDGGFGAGSTALYAELDDTDVALAAGALQSGLETGAQGDSTPWRNSASGHAGSITPRATFVSDSGHFCRRYDERLDLADGRTGTIANIACRDDDGRWSWIAG